MTITLPFFLLTTHLAVGILLVLLTVSTEVKKNFFRFNAIVACVLLMLSLLIRPSAAFHRTSNFYIMVVCPALVLGYVLTLRLDKPGLSRMLLYLSVLSGLTTWSIDIDVLRYYSGFATSLQTLFINFFLSTLLLGSVTLAMILGHWYLVDPKLSIAHLKKITLLFMIALISRIALVAAMLLYYWIASVDRVTLVRILDPMFQGTFFWVRVVTGMVGPLILAFMIWRTIKMRSTQSATGLLYVAVILVLFGELISKYLLTIVFIPL